MILHPTNRTTYKAFGLTIFSDINLAELSAVDFAGAMADVVIIQADVSSTWSELADPNDNFIVKPNLVMFRVPGVAIYLIKNGKEIFVSPFDNSEADQVRLYILGTCMGAILMQRKVLPLHGSAVVIDNKAYAFVGDSGAGKSTLASAFLKRDYQLLSDDVIPITLSDEGIPMVTPAYPQQKLWLKSLDHFGMKSDYLRPIINRETKFAVPVSGQFATKEIPLVGIFEIIKTDKEAIEVFPIKGLEQLHTLFYHTYRNFFIERLGLLTWHFNICAKMTSFIDMYQIRRPTVRFTAHELVEVILTKVNRREKVK